MKWMIASDIHGICILLQRIGWKPSDKEKADRIIMTL